MIASPEPEASINYAPCEGCAGTGIRAPATPSCLLPARYLHWIVVERCDYCEQYPDDLTAARTRFAQAKWIQCATGGWHAVARGTTATSNTRARNHPLRHSTAGKAAGGTQDRLTLKP